ARQRHEDDRRGAAAAGCVDRRWSKSQVTHRFEREVLSTPRDLRTAWEDSALGFIAWAREPMHDSYWLYHRDAFFELLPPPGRRFCLAIGHPFASAGRFDGYDADAPFVVEGSYLERRRYRDTIERDGLTVAFESEHRPIGWYVDALVAAGFILERLREVPIPDE